MSTQKKLANFYMTVCVASSSFAKCQRDDKCRYELGTPVKQANASHRGRTKRILSRARMLTTFMPGLPFAWCMDRLYICACR